MVTQPRQFRLDDTTLGLLDRLAVKTGLGTRVAVIRLATQRLAESEGVIEPPRRMPVRKKKQ